MREYELKTRLELELELLRLTRVTVGPHSRAERKEIDSAYHFDHQFITLVDEWLRKCNVSEDKINSMSGRGKANCYCAGVAWVKSKFTDETDFGDQDFRPTFKSNSPTKPKTRAPRGFGRDVADFSFDEAPTESDLPDLLGLPTPSGAGEARGAMESPSEPTGDSDPDKILVTQEMLKKATNAILGPQVEEFKARAVQQAKAAIQEKLSELDRDIETRVKVEIAGERTEATNRAVEAATKIAVDTALEMCEDFINKRIPRRIEVVLPKETKVLADEPRHKAFDEILFWTSLGMHVYMWGPRGTGKTHLFPQVADALSRKYYPIGQSLSKYDVTGYTSATGDYIKTHARDAMENGGILGVDEGDTWAAAALIALNTPLANKYCPFPDKIVTVHPDFLCMLAANTSGFGATPEYQGRNPLDSTSTDRFVFVHVDYDEDLEIQLFGNTPWVRYVHEVRKYVREELKNPNALPSMRPIQMGTKALAAGGDPDLVIKGVLWKALPQEMINRIETRIGKFGRRVLTEAA